MIAVGAVWQPLCLEPDELEGWRAGTVPACRDCTEGFANEMRAIGRCNGIPGEVLAGSVEEEPMEEPTPIGRKVATEVAVPCGTCSHADICRIRPALAELGRLAVALPVLDPAIDVDLSAMVSCSFYAKDRTRKADVAEPRQSAAGRKLNLSPEERERRRQQALANVEAQRQRREAAAAS